MAKKSQSNYPAMNQFNRLSFAFVLCLSSCSVTNRDTIGVASPEKMKEVVTTDNANTAPKSTGKEQVVEVEPDINEYKALPGDRGHDERVEELLSEVMAGNMDSLLLLGEADIGKETIVKRLKQARGQIKMDDGSDFVGFVLAKLGDGEERMRIEKDFLSGVYAKEDEALSALKYVSDQWSMGILVKGLSIQGGERLVFPSNDQMPSANKAKAPPLRFECVLALDELLPGSGVQSEIDLMRDADVQIMMSWVSKNKSSK